MRTGARAPFSPAASFDTGAAIGAARTMLASARMPARRVIVSLGVSVSYGQRVVPGRRRFQEQSTIVGCNRTTSVSAVRAEVVLLHSPQPIVTSACVRAAREEAAPPCR